jgi:hypothetical protein
MLVIGSRALHHSFPHLRACVDWDFVGTAVEREELATKIEPLRGKPWTAKKGYFLLGDRPVEYIVADDTDWMRVLARPSLKGQVPGVGEVSFATPATLLVLKLSHVHVTGHFWKTAGDIHLLRSRATLALEDDALLEDLRRRAEWRRGIEGCAFGPRLRILPEAASPAVATQRAARLRAFAPTLSRYLDASRVGWVSALPSASDAASVLAEAAMVWSLEEDIASLASLADSARRVAALRQVIEVLCTDVFGRDVRIALNSYAHDALALVPKDFPKRASATVAPASSIAAASLFAPHAARTDLQRFALLTGR